MEAANQLGIENVSEADFRYPGPIPQTKEAAIVMLADTVEAAVRATMNAGSDLDEIENLRDRMATMFWELIEQQPMGKREEIRNNELELSIAERYKDYPRARKDPIGVQQYEESLIYKPKGITYHAEAFAHLAHITPTISNAFFFRENTTG